MNPLKVPREAAEGVRLGGHASDTDRVVNGPAERLVDSIGLGHREEVSVPFSINKFAKDLRWDRQRRKTSRTKTLTFFFITIARSL